MLFNSLKFMIFFPIITLVYFILPKKIRQFWLLLCSYYFYMSWNAAHGLLLLLVTGITYIGGLGIGYIEKSDLPQETAEKRKKLVLTAGIVSNLSLLCYYKYTNFFLDNVRNLFDAFQTEIQVPEAEIILPIGISFFTFQALSYLIDVYRGDIYAEKNFFRYALFVSFFPQLVAGPIERSKNLLKQLAEPTTFKIEHAKEGFWIMLYGFFLKMVIADRIAIYVDTVFGNHQSYQGAYFIVAAILFAFQLYCDFYGYSVIAMGAAKVLGYHLIDNFEAPFFSCSVAELWRRWHISLNTWFRDYAYIPLGGGKKGKIRKNINKIIVFFISGLWHGANWTYVVWGVMNGVYQMIGEVLLPVRNRVVAVARLDRSTISHKLYQRIFTFLAFAFSMIFFRASSLTQAAEVIKSIASVHNYWILFDGSIYQCGLDAKNFTVLLWGIIILLASDYFKYRGLKIREVIMQQEAWFRILFAAGSILLILVLGVWGTAYEQAGFIYFQF